MEILKSQWQKLASKYCSNPLIVDQYWKEIETAYSHKKRYYHNLSHIESLLNQVLKYKEHIQDFDTLCFAIWYHDIVYKVTRKDNELKSAELARQRLEQLGLEKERIELCYAQILATKAHSAEGHPDISWLLDFDLSKLGAEEKEYNAYAAQIRKEYRLFPDLIYKPGRKKVLQHFLSLERIYKTKAYFENFEQQARINLKTELNNL